MMTVRKIVTLLFALCVCASTLSATPIFGRGSGDKKPKKEGILSLGLFKKRAKSTADMPLEAARDAHAVAPKAQPTAEAEPELNFEFLAEHEVASTAWDYSAETLDSLLTNLHSHNTVRSFEEFFDDFLRPDTTERITSTVPDSVYEARLRAILSPIGLPWNPIVKQFIVFYTTNRRTTMSRVLSRSQYYFPIIEAELMKAGLPLELRMLPVVESALLPTVRSGAGATGLWQFMYGTGKTYGLEQTTFVDQRCDPVASTRAACRYLADLYKIYGDWTLALAAYNCGPGNVNKAFKRAGETGSAKNYWDIYPYLPRETRDYVPSFIAATYAYVYHRQHNIDFEDSPLPLAVDTVTVGRLMHLEQVSTTLDVPLETLRMLNPQYRKDIIPALDKRYPLVLPQSQIARYIEHEPTIMGKDSLYLAQYLNPANISNTKAILTATTTTTIHRVKNGENLGLISKRYGVTVKQIISWNKLKNPSKLKVGQRLEIRK
ncbi:MAG: transglycosylase SLT domain-containing protein [Rikenellaceae bacterium]|jgi:membrane-bound lytic murein transglycosylase D|nr:transglycosylase SLT domain-containing protein [Rikenellaceae bacterium]